MPSSRDRPHRRPLQRASRASCDGLVITSLQNEKIKAIRALDMRKERKASGLFVAEGASVLIAAMEQGQWPETLVRLDDEAGAEATRRFVEWAQARGSQTLTVSAGVLAKLSHKDNPQSLLGVFRQQFEDLPDHEGIGARSVYVILEEVRDTGNLGTIIRTVDAVGGAGVILVGNCCDPYSRECVRATMGSIFAVSLMRASLDAFLAWRASWPGDAVATDLGASLDFRSARYRHPVLLMMGREGPGLSATLSAAASQRVVIPMAGRLDSLNLSVATALALYQICGRDLKVRSD